MIQSFSAHSLLHSEPSPAFNHVFINSVLNTVYRVFLSCSSKFSRLLPKIQFQSCFYIFMCLQQQYPTLSTKICISYSLVTNWLQFSSVAQSHLTLCDPMNRSTPGLPVHHQLPEFTQTHVHWVGDAIQPSHLCRPLLLLPPIPPSIRVFSNESTLHMRWPKYWSFSFSISLKTTQLSESQKSKTDWQGHSPFVVPFSTLKARNILFF